MQSAGENLKNMASSAKEHIDVYKAKVEEKTEKDTARSPEEKEIAHQRRKAKEAEAKMELHEAKATHAAEKLVGKQAHLYSHVHHPHAAGAYGTHQPVVGTHGHHLPLGAIDPVTGTAVPTYPLGGHPTGHMYK